MSRLKPSSAANGRLSHGPTSQAGKDISRRNALKFGFYSKDLSHLNCEPVELFLKHHQNYVNILQPENAVQEDLVRTVAGATWGIQRAQFIERDMLDQAIESSDRDGEYPLMPATG